MVTRTRLVQRGALSIWHNRLATSATRTARGEYPVLAPTLHAAAESGIGARAAHGRFSARAPCCLVPRYHDRGGRRTSDTRRHGRGTTVTPTGYFADAAGRNQRGHPSQRLVGAHLGQPCAHIEVQLHQASITVVEIDNGEASVGDTGLLPGSGLLGLLDEIAEAIGQQFVAQTRFDPQRRADTEQALYEQIPGLLKMLATQSEVSCTLDDHTARINTDTLRRVGEALSRELRQALPESITHIALDSLLSDLPGLTLPHPTTEVAPSDLWQAVGDHLVPTGGELIFQRRLTCPAQVGETALPATEAAEPLSLQTAPSQATHQLVSGHATPMRTGEAIAPGVVLAAPGTVQISPDTVVQLNGQTREGEVSIQPGDRLVVGTLEVLFISVDG